MKNSTGAVIVIIYLLICLALLVFSGIKLYGSAIKNEEIGLFLICLLIGGCGGLLYCLRGVYLNYSVKRQWSNQWIPWYIVRPFVSVICGGVSYIFLKAGLLILESEREVDATNLGFYALSFISGMNVDKFISKIEDLAQATWGIDKSRAGKGDSA